MHCSLLKKFIAASMSLLLAAGAFCSSVMPISAATSGLDTSRSTDNMTNLVVFVNFKDTTHAHFFSGWGKCFLEDPNLEKLFYGEKNSLRQYVYDVTYGAVRLANVFPQYDSSNKKITAVTLPQNSSYYTAGYPDSSFHIVADTVATLNSQGIVSASYNLDRNGDGAIDNLTIVVPCESGNSNTALSGLCGAYPGGLTLNGKRVQDYNIITESGAYLSVGQSGLLCHEFLHVLGYSDLYRSGASPLGRWDIMSSECCWLQAPLAYERMRISHAFSINTVTTSQSGVHLNSVSSALRADASDSVKNNQALILKTPYSDDEFFVVEYRKQQSASDAYEHVVHGSGLIIYRVNNTVSDKTNKSAGPYYLYVFRQNDSMIGGVEEAPLAKLDTSYLSAEVGRTSFGQANPTMGLEDNAITYSDGTNSGIVIKNVSGTSGDTITFDIEFNNNFADVWDTYSNESVSSHIFQMDTTVGTDGTLYAALDFFNGSADTPALYAIHDASWERMADLPDGDDYHLASFQGKIYLLYYGSDSKSHFCVLTGTSWDNLYTGGSDWSGASLVAASDGVYGCVCAANSVDTFRYTASFQSLGAVTGLNYPSNAKICLAGSVLYLVLRDVFASNTIRTYQWSNGFWSLVNSNLVSGGYSGIDSIAIGQNLYLLDDGRLLYHYQDGWSKVGDVSSESAMSYAMAEGNRQNLYIAYRPNSQNTVYAVTLKGDALMKVGDSVVNNSALSWLGLSKSGDNMYVSYLEGANYNASIKRHAIPGKLCSHSFVTTKAACHTDGQKKCSLCSYSELIPAVEDFSSEVRGATSIYSGDLYCKTCGQLVQKGHAFAITPTESATSGNTSSTKPNGQASTAIPGSTTASTTGSGTSQVGANQESSGHTGHMEEASGEGILDNPEAGTTDSATDNIFGTSSANPENQTVTQSNPGDTVGGSVSNSVSNSVSGSASEQTSKDGNGTEASHPDLPGHRSFPYWIIGIIAGALVMSGGVVGFIFLRKRRRTE